MQLLVNNEGKKKSIEIEGLTDWQWAPSRNLIAYTCFYVDEEGENTSDPKICFMKIPERLNICQKIVKGGKELKLRFHPQGFYLAVMNTY